MADIMMSYEAMADAASKINTAKEELGTLISNLTSVVSTLGEGYEGEGYVAFKSAWEQSKPTMERLKEAVGEFGPVLTAAAKNQEELEQANKQRMGDLAF